jgi:predicted dehydrogenase
VKTNTPLRVGIAGYGVVGKRRRTFIDQHPDLHTVAVCDRAFSQPASLDDGVPYFTHYTELLEQDLDVLFVCLTNDVAAEVCVHGLESGLHVFCEKPPGRDLIDMARVKRVADKHPELCLKYGFNHRYHKSVLDALELLNSGNLGRVVDMRGVYGKSRFISFKEDSGWRTQRDIAGGGILLDQGIHMVDLMRLFAGEFVDIHSFISNDYWNHDVEDNAYAIMRTAKGQVAMLQSSATQWRHRFNLDITCEQGGLTMSGILSGSKSYGAETLTVVWKADDDAGDPKEVTTRYNEDPSWQSEIDEFADAVLRDGEIVSGSIDDAVATMSLVYKIYCADPAWRDRWQLIDSFSNSGD